LFGGADPAVYRLTDATYYIIAGGTGKSVDGGRTFQPSDFAPGSWGQPDVIAVAGGFRCFYSTMNGVRSAFSFDGTHWQEEEGIRFRDGADPTVVRLKNGTYHLYYKVRGVTGT
jgi:hypothetical protein